MGEAKRRRKLDPDWGKGGGAGRKALAVKFIEDEEVLAPQCPETYIALTEMRSKYPAFNFWIAHVSGDNDQSFFCIAQVQVRKREPGDGHTENHHMTARAYILSDGLRCRKTWSQKVGASACKEPGTLLGGILAAAKQEFKEADLLIDV